MSRVDAVVMAGGSADAIRSGVAYKGLVEVAGKPLAQWVIEALRSASTVDRIIVTIPDERDRARFAELADSVVVTDRDFSENAIAGLDQADPDRPVLMCTGDIPALAPEDVDSFVRDALATGADIVYPLILRSAIEERFPGSQRTYFTLDGEQLTGGNCTLSTVAGGHRIRERAQKLFEARKNPLQVASMAGPALMTKFAMGRATSDDVVKKATKILGIPCAVVKTRAASLGADVDKPEDVPIVEEALAQGV